MARSTQRFAQLLTEAIYQIRHRESKPLQVVQDELGYALGRAGASAIEYWRKGHLPPTHRDIEQLAAALVQRGGLDQPWLERFLDSAGYAEPADLFARCFPTTPARPVGPLPSTPAEPASPAVTPHQEHVGQLAPFVVGPPILSPRQFFGRTAELRVIFDLWKQHPLQNVAILGARRTGKTSLLHYLATITRTPASEVRPGQRTDWLPHPERYRWVFIDFQDARMCQRERLLRYLLASLMLPIPDPCQLDTFLDTVSQQLQTPTIILMDEIGAGLAAPELDQRFWWSLRSLGTIQTGGHLGFVLAAHEEPARLAHEHGKPSPFFNIFGHSFTLGPLREDEARALIATAPLPFDPDDCTWILEQSGGWPYQLQLLCHIHLSALRQGDTTAAWRTLGLQRLAHLSTEGY